MDDRARQRLLELNDPLLYALIDAADDAGRMTALERVVTEHAAPVMRGVLSRYGSTPKEELEDLQGAIMLRLVRKLQMASRSETEAIGRLEDYVAALTFNAASDMLRRRFPERTRLRNRLRHVLERDERLDSWQTPAGLVTGLVSMRDQPGHAIPSGRAIADDPVLHDRHRDGDALVALFEQLQHPLPFDELARTMVDLWNVHETATLSVDVNTADAHPSHFATIEHRQYLASLWSEIRLLPPPQRAALLLNLRDTDGMNALALFILVEVAHIDDIAEAAGLKAEELAELWNQLPLDDLAIASMLHLSRQQVINLRKSARQRLMRRMNKSRPVDRASGSAGVSHR